MKLGVSGCLFQCAETNFKDIGLVGKPKGWTIMIGGCGGGRARVGDKLVEDLPTEQALEVVDRLVEYFKTHAKTHDRMARLVERDGLETIRQAVGLSLAICAVVPAAETI